MSSVHVDTATPVQIISRDAVNVYDDRLASERGQPKCRVLQPQLRHPADAYCPVAYRDAMREPRVLHCHTPHEAQQVEDCCVLPYAAQALPTWAVQLHGIDEEREVLRLGEEQWVASAQRVNQLAKVQVVL